MPRNSVNRRCGVAIDAVMARAWCSIRIKPVRDGGAGGLVNAFFRMHTEHLPITVANWRRAPPGTTLESC